MAPDRADPGGAAGERARLGAAALIAYFETSAFLPLFVDEAGSPRAAEVWRAARNRVSCRLLYPEARAALAAAARSGRLDPSRLRLARSLLERLWSAVDRIEITGAIAQRAGDLTETHSLRGYDAVHLAAFEAVAGDDTLLVTFDHDLRRAALASGFVTTRLP